VKTVGFDDIRDRLLAELRGHRATGRTTQMLADVTADDLVIGIGRFSPHEVNGARTAHAKSFAGLRQAIATARGSKGRIVVDHAVLERIYEDEIRKLDASLRDALGIDP
jgi:hypothetical protein